MQNTDDLAALPRELADAIREHREVRALWQGEIDDDLAARNEASDEHCLQLRRDFLVPRARERAAEFRDDLLRIAAELLKIISESELLGVTARLGKALHEVAHQCRGIHALLTNPYRDCVTGELDLPARGVLIIPSEEWLPLTDYLNRLNLEIMEALKTKDESHFPTIRLLASRIQEEAQKIEAPESAAQVHSADESTESVDPGKAFPALSQDSGESELTPEEIAEAVDSCNILRVPVVDDQTAIERVQQLKAALIKAAEDLSDRIAEYEDAKGSVPGIADLYESADAWEEREQFAADWLAMLNDPMACLYELLRMIPQAQSRANGSFPPALSEAGKVPAEIRAVELLRSVTAALGEVFPHCNKGFRPVAFGVLSNDEPIMLGWDAMDFETPLPTLDRFIAPLKRATTILSECQSKAQLQWRSSIGPQLSATLCADDTQSENITLADGGASNTAADADGVRAEVCRTLEAVYLDTLVTTPHFLHVIKHAVPDGPGEFPELDGHLRESASESEVLHWCNGQCVHVVCLLMEASWTEGIASGRDLSVPLCEALGFTAFILNCCVDLWSDFARVNARRSQEQEHTLPVQLLGVSARSWHHAVLRLIEGDLRLMTLVMECDPELKAAREQLEREYELTAAPAASSGETAVGEGVGSRARHRADNAGSSMRREGEIVGTETVGDAREDKRSCDGPACDDDGFRFNGTIYPVKDAPFRLLKALWESPKRESLPKDRPCVWCRAARADAVAAAVLLDRQAGEAEMIDAFRGIQSRLHRFFNDNALPFRVSLAPRSHLDYRILWLLRTPD